jgi:isoquinoline 1-oxidoreductase
MADTAKTPYDMGTFGSRTTPTMNLQLRKVASAAREVLVDRAAQRLSVPRETITVYGGNVVATTNDRAAATRSATKSVTFADLVKGEPLVATVTDQTPLKAPGVWRVAGTKVPKINGRDMVTGRHRYTTDITRRGMLHAKVIRPPAYGATLVNADTSAASAMSNVIVVRDGAFLAVAAPTQAEATAAASAITAEWTPGTRASASTLFADLKSKAERPVESAVDAQYTIAYIAHAPLEPRAALAEWQGEQLTVWTGTQRPFGVQQELVDAFRVGADRVRVIVPDTGSAYGGKHTGDAAIEAARIARAAKKPVKLVWTREEEFAWAYFRPAGVIDVRAATDKEGVLTSWEFHNYNSGPSGLQTPYVVADKREAFHPSPSPLRQGSYRGLAATANHFARESHMDDLAHGVGIDPLAFRLKNLRDRRLIDVLRAATQKFGWDDRKQSPTVGMGLACGIEKGGYTAVCAEIEMRRGGGPLAPEAPDVRIRRLVVAFECGAIVNPDGLDHQVSGAIVQGLGGALFEAIDYEDGRLVNGRFAAYRLPRFSDVPPIEVVLLNRPDLPPAGAGETPIVGLAPALGNAIFDATGVRLRSLPLLPRRLTASSSQFGA